MNECNVNVTIKRKEYNGKLVYVAYIKEYPDCVGQGITVDEAYKEVMDNFRALVEYCKENGKELKLLKTEEDYSGRILLRIPKSLHKKLALNAEAEGISLNSYLVNCLTQKDLKIDFIKTLEYVVQNIPILIQSNNDIRFKLLGSNNFSKKKEVVYYGGNI